MDTTPARPMHPLRVAGIALILATVPAAFLTKAMIVQGVSPGAALVAEALPWFGWALLTPAIFGLARRFPVDRPPRVRAYGLHLLFGLAAGLVQGVVAVIVSSRIEYPADIVTPHIEPRSLILMWLAFGVIMYGAIAAIGFAVDYRTRLVERERAADRLEHLLIESRLGALRTQLQPHFLFNALNTVAMLVREGDRDTAVRVIARFSELLRGVLDEEAPQEVSLGEELEFVGRYLEIERVRFGDRLRVHVEADDAARSAAVPHLVLQPIVENAVRHGISRRADAARIDIVAERAHDRLRVSVRDDGPGLPAGWSAAACRGIGLRNTRDRLHYLYGDGASLELCPAEGGGVRAVIELPLRGGNNGA